MSLSRREYLCLASLLTLFLGGFVAAPPATGKPDDVHVTDWLLQDRGATPYLLRDHQGIRDCFQNAADHRIERDMVTKVLAETPDAGLQSAAEQLVNGNVPGQDPRWKALYIKACEKRRAARLAALSAKTQRIVFTKHFNMGGSHYAYTEGLSDAARERHFKPGGGLYLYHLDSLYGGVETLLEAGPEGVIRDPDVSYDGRRVLFAWKKSLNEDDYHLYEMDLDTRKVRQLTFGLGYADYEGVYLPNDDIIFNSTRCIQAVDCWWTEVSNLYTCDRNGKYMRRLGFDQVHVNYPQVLPDGRVVYTRWDYNDRGQIYPQPLFQMNWDGTGQTEYYGNNSWWPTTVGHARGIEGSDKVIAIATGHHSRQIGALILIDVKQGRQEAEGATLVAPVVEDKKDRRYRRVDGYIGHDGHYQYPYPINEREYVASYGTGNTRPDTMNGYSLYYVRDDGARELLVTDPEISCNQPVFLRPRARPALPPSTVDHSKKTGTYYVQDVYIGPGLKGIARGTVKKLRVIALEYRPAAVQANRSRGPAGGALVSTPVSCDNATWDVKRVLGDATVHPDGSAFFEVPARTPVYFQCIDGEGQAVQTMRTWSTLMPGENFSCIGCHEAKDAVPPAPIGGVTMAMKAGPQKLEPFYGPARGFSFAKEIQPILDKHCVTCHDGTQKDKEGKLILSLRGETGERKSGRAWLESYLALTRKGPNELVQWLNVQSVPTMLPPYYAGSSKSKLMTMLREQHGEAKLAKEDLDKIACWIDLLVPYCGDYREAAAWNEHDITRYEYFLEKRHKMEAFEQENIRAWLEKQGRL